MSFVASMKACIQESTSFLISLVRRLDILTSLSSSGICRARCSTSATFSTQYGFTTSA